MNRPRTAAAALAAAGILTATVACSGSAQSQPRTTATATATVASATAVALPHTRPGAQARWLLGAIAHLPIPVATIRAHFDQAFLAQVPPATLNADLAQLKGLQLDAVGLSTSEYVILVITIGGQTRTATVNVDARGLISSLPVAPIPAEPAPPPQPTTWAGVDSLVQGAAPQARLLVAQVNGGACRPVQAIGATTPEPLGSAFKLYVLDALARAVAAGRVSWNQRITVTSGLKSLPSGALQDEPDGTQVTVLQTAEDMISASDNTAANLLINLVGRSAVEAAAVATGMADPALDTPFLNTRELFVLKLDDWPSLADQYLALNSAGRLAFLTGTVDRAPLPTLAAAASWTTPRDINSIEWFASADDICKVYASLAALARQPGLAPVASILEINNGGLGLDPRQWRSVWYKGGDEPGVVTVNYLATTRGGQTYMVSVLAANPAAPISEAAQEALFVAVKGAFTLAAQPGHGG